MNLAYKKTLGQFTKVLGIGKTPPIWEKFPNNPVIFFWERTYTKNNACKSCGLTDGSSFQDINLIRLLSFPKLGTSADRARPGLAFQNKSSLQNIKAPTSWKLLKQSRRSFSNDQQFCSTASPSQLVNCTASLCGQLRPCLQVGLRFVASFVLLCVVQVLWSFAGRDPALASILQVASSTMTNHLQAVWTWAELEVRSIGMLILEGHRASAMEHVADLTSFKDEWRPCCI